jgi:hypothetical protein
VFVLRNFVFKLNMMRRFFPLFPVFMVLFACQSPAPKTTPSTPLKSELQKVERKLCVNDSACVLLNISYPVLVGGNIAITDTLNNDIQRVYRKILNADDKYAELAFPVMIDSASNAVFNFFKQLRAEIPESAITEWTLNASGNVPVLNNRIITVEILSDSYLGGAHPSSAATITTYDLTTGKALGAADFLKDPNAVLPMLEKAYLAEKNGDANGNLSDLLFPEIKSLPLPKNVAVESNGIRFHYNDYEVAPHAVGPADLLLTWEQLGDQADKKKWLE